jgi:hypothetical protein
VLLLCHVTVHYIPKPLLLSLLSCARLWWWRLRQRLSWWPWAVLSCNSAFHLGGWHEMKFNDFQTTCSRMHEARA